MRMIVALAFSFFLASAAAGESDAALARGVEALLAKQSADGGWRSDKYGLLKPGVALTALTVETLSRLPAERRAKHAEAIARGVSFLSAATDASGAVGLAGEWPEYPTYATALALQAETRLQPKGWAALALKRAAWLCAAQNSERNGCAKEHAAHGGWNANGAPRAGVAHHADLSTTRVVSQSLLAALRIPDVSVEQAAEIRAALQRADVFRRRCQNLGAEKSDGGFVFTASQGDLNKAGTARQPSGFASYGSATADGVLLLDVFLALDPRSDFAILRVDWTAARDAALGWLKRHPESVRVPGFKDGDTRAVSMRFYYRATAAQALAHDEAFLKALAEQTRTEQNAAGHFANENAVMKEDDPLIATCLALQVLIAVETKKPGP